MKIEIKYGKSKKIIEIPHNNLESVVKGDIKLDKKIDENEVIKKALFSPIKSGKLADLARGKRNATILVSDITRPSPSYKFLPGLIDALNFGGIEDIKIIFGLGIHRKQTFEERLKLAGSYAASKAELIDSDKSKCKLIGRTSYNTPVEIFKEALGSDLLIATGNIEYHYFAGYSGGAKAVMPGISSYAAIANNHSYMLCDDASAGNITTNPVRADIEESGKMFGIDFIFNVILDDNKNIIDAVSGSNNEAFLEGVKRYDRFFKKYSTGKSDIVITSPGGYPKDLNLYQSHKALENVKEIVADGGKLILIAQCSEGFGEDTFEKWMYNAKDYKYLKKRIEDKFVLGGHKAVAISKILYGVEIFLFSDFDRITTDKIGFKKIKNLQEFIDSQIKANENIKITVVPTGRLVKYKKNN